MTDPLGRGVAFPPRIGPDGAWASSEGETNVAESMRIILSTDRNERIFRPDFGAGLRSVLFAPNTVATRQQIADRITRALARWEPRIRVESVAVEPGFDAPDAAIATIRYRLVATGATASLDLDVRLNGQS